MNEANYNIPCIECTRLSEHLIITETYFVLRVQYYMCSHTIGCNVGTFDITMHHTFTLRYNTFSNYNIILNHYFKSLFLYLELQDYQTLMMIEKKASLAKTQQIADLEEKLKLTSTLSSGLY